MTTLAEARRERKNKQRRQANLFARLKGFQQEALDDLVRRKIANAIQGLEDAAYDIEQQREAWWAEVDDADEDDMLAYEEQLAYENEAEAMLQPLYALLELINEVQASLLACENEDIDESLGQITS